MPGPAQTIHESFLGTRPLPGYNLPMTVMLLKLLLAVVTGFAMWALL